MTPHIYMVCPTVIVVSGTVIVVSGTVIVVSGIVIVVRSSRQQYALELGVVRRRRVRQRAVLGVRVLELLALVQKQRPVASRCRLR